MQDVQIGVVRGRAFCSSDGFVIYGDNGTGAVDWDHPLSDRRVLLWPEVCPPAGHLADGHLSGRHLDGYRPDGHLRGTHLMDACLYPAATVQCEKGPYVFGRFGFAIVMCDAAGNREIANTAFREVVVNSEPEPPRDLRPSAYDDQSGRMTFAFKPSERLAG
jgi:hypothetical protein